MTNKDHPSSFVIPAECHSDDRAVEIQFDALKWFEQASDEEIADLVLCGFGGDYPADIVADYFDCSTTRPLFFYLEEIVDRLKSCGFECYVNEEAARKWIGEHRPNLAAIH